MEEKGEEKIKKKMLKENEDRVMIELVTGIRLNRAILNFK